MKCVRCQQADGHDEHGGLCYNCWEVEHRIRRYLKAEGGRIFITNILKEIQYDVVPSKNRSTKRTED